MVTNHFTALPPPTTATNNSADSSSSSYSGGATVAPPTFSIQLLQPTEQQVTDGGEATSPGGSDGLVIADNVITEEVEVFEDNIIDLTDDDFQVTGSEVNALFQKEIKTEDEKGTIEVKLFFVLFCFAW